MNKIPRIIHYCWYGKSKKPGIVKKCIDSWKKTNPDFNIVEWNESNSPNHPIVKKNIKKSLYAFASDYTRLFALYNHGGIYLDTDVYLNKSLKPLLQYDAFLALESEQHITNGVSGSARKHHFFKSCLVQLEKRGHSKTTPYLSAILTMDVLKTLTSDIKFEEQFIDNIKVLLPHSFYPFSFEQSKLMKHEEMIKNCPRDSFGVHLFMHSWKESSQLSFIESCQVKLKNKVKLIIENCATEILKKD